MVSWDTLIGFADYVPRLGALSRSHGKQGRPYNQFCKTCLCVYVDLGKVDERFSDIMGNGNLRYQNMNKYHINKLSSSK